MGSDTFKRHSPEEIEDDDRRRNTGERPILAGVAVREDDIEQVRGIRAVSILFRSMAILLLALMAVQLFFGLTSTVPISIGVLLAETVRLIIFAGLLWGAGDLATLWVKSHHDIRATRILVARQTHIMREAAKAKAAAAEASSREGPAGR